MTRMPSAAGSLAQARWSIALGRRAVATSTPAVPPTSSQSSPDTGDAASFARITQGARQREQPPRVSQDAEITSGNSATSEGPATPSRSEAATTDEPSVSAAAHLFALAAEEDAQPPPSRSQRPNPLLSELDERPWTGDEPIEATVLRMLIDKHKPQRTGKIKSSDDRIREEVQRSALERMMDEGKGMGRQGSGGARVEGGGGTDEGGYLARGIKRNTKVFPGHLVGGDPEHEPWMSEYATPSASESPLVKRGVLLAPARPGLGRAKEDPAVRRALRRERALLAGPVRAVNARGKVLDFQLDRIAVKNRGSSGLAQLTAAKFDHIDEDLDVRVVMTPADYRIEQARLDGAFDNLSGRGKPLDPHHGSTSNPYIGRHEFFMNQAFKKNDVLPPWIESRKQHTAALETLHTSLAAMLHRRLLVHPDLPRFASLGQIERLRVREVEQGGSEHAFWFDMVKDVNSKGRSADGIGPPSTRKGTTTLATELERAYPKAAQMAHSSIHAPPPAPIELNKIDTSKINWGMDWSFLEAFALYRWWAGLRAPWKRPP